MITTFLSQSFLEGHCSLINTLMKAGGNNINRAATRAISATSENTSDINP